MHLHRIRTVLVVTARKSAKRCESGSAVKRLCDVLGRGETVVEDASGSADAGDAAFDGTCW